MNRVQVWGDLESGGRALVHSMECLQHRPWSTGEGGHGPTGKGQFSEKGGGCAL